MLHPNEVMDAFFRIIIAVLIRFQDTACPPKMNWMNILFK